MNTLIKPPCCNGEAQSKRVDQHLLEMTNFSSQNIWLVTGYSPDDAENYFSNTIIVNNSIDDVLSGEELVDEIQDKFIGVSLSDCLDIAEAIIKHLIDNPNCPKSLVNLMHDFKP